MHRQNPLFLEWVRLMRLQRALMRVCNEGIPVPNGRISDRRERMSNQHALISNVHERMSAMDALMRRVDERIPARD